MALPSMGALSLHTIHTRVVATGVFLLPELPGDAMGNVVTQAALAARGEQKPVHHICEWMKHYCTAAERVGKCEDDWYRLALAVFGFVPTTYETTSTLPGWSGFENWKSLFLKLCRAFDPDFIEPTTQPSGWRRKRFASSKFWLFLKTRLSHRDGVQVEMIRQFFKDDMSQRDADLLLDAVLAAGFGLHLPGDVDTTELEAFWFGKGEGPDPSIKKIKSPWMAVVTMLWLRGAKPFQTKHYEEVDNDMYLSLALTLGGSGEHVDTRMSQDEANDRIRLGLSRGGDPNYEGKVFYKVLWLTNSENIRILDDSQVLQSGAKSLLTIALVSENGPAVKLLVDAGAHLMPDGPSLRILRQALQYFLKPVAAGDRETTEKLIAMMAPPESELENFYLNDSHRELSNWLNDPNREQPVPLWMQQKVTSLLNVTRIRWARRGYV